MVIVYITIGVGLGIAAFFIVRVTLKENKEAKAMEEKAKVRSEERAARRQSHNR